MPIVYLLNHYLKASRRFIRRKVLAVERQVARLRMLRASMMTRLPLQ
jgi:hypothetical protein